MVGYAPVIVPILTYGAASDTTGAILQTNYRINTWTNSVTSNTYPATWDSGYAYATNAASATTIEIDYVQYHDFDNITWTQHTRMPGYRVRVIQGGVEQTNWYANDTSVWRTYRSPPLKTPGERLKEILESRMAPGVLGNRKAVGLTNDVREMRARETLRRVIGEEKYKNFLRRGSVSVQAKSGLSYQIFPGHNFTRVYDRGTMVEQLCVVLSGNFPPTDSLIVRYLMILNNEQQFRKLAVKHGVYTQSAPVQPDQRSLVEIFKELKKVG